MLTAQPIHMDCAAILFDLDGVLIDSTTCVERHWRDWAEQHGLDALRILRIAHGVRNVDTMRLLAPHLDVEKEAAVFAAGEVADTAGVVAIEGASQIIEILEGARWAVVTSCSTALAHARLEAAKLPVPPLLITSDDVQHGKPHPQPYLLAASRLGIAAEGCVVVEDAPAGIQAGKKAGMRVIGIAATYSREELVESGADVVIDQLRRFSVRQAPDGRRLVIQIELQA
jgi:mannitol-1-/sugar-/sorbitol-6-phosphatase